MVDGASTTTEVQMPVNAPLFLHAVQSSQDTHHDLCLDWLVNKSVRVKSHVMVCNADLSTQLPTLSETLNSQTGPPTLLQVRQKDAAVANEEYDEAKRLKASIDRLKASGCTLWQTESSRQKVL